MPVFIIPVVSIARRDLNDKPKKNDVNRRRYFLDSKDKLIPRHAPIIPCLRNCMSHIKKCQAYQRFLDKKSNEDGSESYRPPVDFETMG